jgi:hypothetical protein
MIFAIFSSFRVLHHLHFFTNHLITMSSSTFDKIYELSIFIDFPPTTTEAVLTLTTTTLHRAKISTLPPRALFSHCTFPNFFKDFDVNLSNVKTLKNVMIFAIFSDFRVLHHLHFFTNHLITMSSSTFDKIYELFTFHRFFTYHH